jgi:hypothetical protein
MAKETTMQIEHVLVLDDEELSMLIGMHEDLIVEARESGEHEEADRRTKRVEELRKLQGSEH